MLLDAEDHLINAAHDITCAIKLLLDRANYYADSGKVAKQAETVVKVQRLRATLKRLRKTPEPLLPSLQRRVSS